jgi:sortase A
MERLSNMKVISSGLERLLLILGLLLLSFYAAARIPSLLSSRAELSRFWEAQETASRAETASASLQDGASPDFHLWSAQRIAGYKKSLNSAVPLPLAVLSIPAIHLKVPVLEGTDEFTLNRAVGHIDGTPEPGQNGNVGIAGHRDGFFRGLKDIHDGDAIELITRKETARYLVDEILIVSPGDVFVLRPRPKTSLTLVTCFPFYYVGHAPKRYIVHASIANPVDSRKAGSNVP